MERRKKEREEQERQSIQKEESRKKKAEIEARSKKEGEISAKLEASFRTNAIAVEEDLMRGFAAAADQDKRDKELAFRLAQETSTVAVDHTQDMQLKLSNFVGSRANNKPDLSGWAYPDLRDATNTSCDVELLEACRVEFDRRLKVYHEWKSKNPGGKNVVNEVEERAPKSIYQHQQSHHQTPSPTPPASGSVQQRYFRIPFTKDGQNKGLWYAHFDGQNIARQMEIHPGKSPVLMLAGRDDMNMCELRLSETGLTRKCGAEILEYDFEEEWYKNVVTELEKRTPKSISQHQQSHEQLPSPTPLANGSVQHRYFRIPFTKDGRNKGLWYAHFDGQQMEIHPGKSPVLMLAGRDDMNMCELRLSETGLTRKHGAEILEYDFQKEWDKNSAEPCMKTFGNLKI